MNTETSQTTLFEATAACMNAVLHAIGLGVLLVDEHSRLHYANRAARGELQIGAGLALQDGRVVAPSAAQQRSLLQAIGGAVQGRRALVEVGSGAQASMRAVIPVGPALGHGATLVLILSGLREERDPVALALFAKTTGLTASEHDVLVFLCSGMDAQQIADHRSVSLCTVRSQIGAIRGKVGVRNVLHAVRKVTALPPIAPVQALV